MAAQHVEMEYQRGNLPLADCAGSLIAFCLDLWLLGDIHRWVCHDFPELKLAVENYVLNDFDATR